MNPNHMLQETPTLSADFEVAGDRRRGAGENLKRQQA
jgi:hypothetical protein